MEVDHQPQQPSHERPQHHQAPAADALDLVGGPFAVIESDPGVFTSLTRRLGIPSLELIELFSIEPWATDHLSPHGLILCFLWKKDAHRPADFDDPAAEKVWFANQLSDDACATHAILNVVLNCPGVDVGEELRAFRRETEGMSPVMRGLAVTNSRVIRPAHNSLARPSDIRASINNLAITTSDAEKRKEKEQKASAKLKEKEKEKEAKPHPAKRPRTGAATKAGAKGKGKEKEKSSAKAKPKPKPRRKAKKKDNYDSYSSDDAENQDQYAEESDEDTDNDTDNDNNNEEETYHFIGYVPAHGKVWELDGLKSGPLEVGELPSPAPSSSPLPPSSSHPTSSFPSSSSHPNSNSNQGWMDIARPALRMKMAKYGGAPADGDSDSANGNIRFSLLAIVDDAFRNAWDELEFWRRERGVLERRLGEVDLDLDEKEKESQGWEAMVDPSLLAASHTAFTPTYPLPIPSQSAIPDPDPGPGPASSQPPPPQTSSDPQSSSTPTPSNPQPSASNPQPSSTSRPPSSTPTPSTPNPPQPQHPHPTPTLKHKPYAADFAARRMVRDIEIASMGRQELLSAWERAVREGGRARREVEDEVSKGGRAETDHIKRTHDYEPFIREYMHRLRLEALLNPLLDRDEEGRKVKVKVKGKAQGTGKKG